MTDRRTPSDTEQPQAHSAPDLFNLDLSTVIGSLQSSVDEMRQNAQQEVSRLESEHAAERARLEQEIESLRQRCVSQDERMHELQYQIRALMTQYRTDLESQIEKADGARQQMYRVQQLMATLEEPVRADNGAPESGRSVIPETLSRAGRRHRTVSAGKDPDPAPTGEETVQIDPADLSLHTAQISISGVTSVSAMMRARKAVESLPGIRDVESRYASEGNLFFSVRTERNTKSLSKALTSLPDPPLKSRKVSDEAIELEM